MQTDRLMVENLISQKISAAKKKYGAEFEMILLEILGLQKLLAPEKKEQSREIPLTEWNEHHPDPSVKALRMLVFRSKENGFDMVIRRRGKRVLIDENAYFRWRELKERGEI